MEYAAQLSDVPNFGKKALSVNGVDIILINVKGEVFACEKECPHQGAPLDAAIVKDGYLSCPRHGYRFDLKTGACRDASQYALKVFPVQIVDGKIMVDLG